jgi:hypothetical protein
MMPTRHWLGFALGSCLLTLTGCGTWMHGDHQSVTLFTTPADTNVVVDDVVHMLAPGTVTLSRKADHRATFAKDGYDSATYTIKRTWSWWVVGDVLGCAIIFSPLCIMHDIDEGGYYTFDEKIYFTLDRKTVDSPPTK